LLLYNFILQTKTQIKTLFAKHSTTDDEENINGNIVDLVSFSEALNMDLAKLDIMIVCYFCHAEHFPYITEDEFIQGLGRMKCDNYLSLKKKIQNVLKNISYTNQNQPFMISFFKWLFLYLKNQPNIAENTKRLPMMIKDEDDDIIFTVKTFFDLLFNDKWKLYSDHFSSFLELCCEKECTSFRMPLLKSIGEDEWNMLYKFACTYPNDCDHYEDGSWPSLFDSFGELYWNQVVVKKNGNNGETKA